MNKRSQEVLDYLEMELQIAKDVPVDGGDMAYQMLIDSRLGMLMRLQKSITRILTDEDDGNDQLEMELVEQQ
jgi:hypothetical protein